MALKVPLTAGGAGSLVAHHGHDAAGLALGGGGAALATLADSSATHQAAPGAGWALGLVPTGHLATPAVLAELRAAAVVPLLAVA